MELSLPTDFEAADAPRVLNQARPLLDVPADAELRVENVTRTSRSTRIEFTVAHSVALDEGVSHAVAGLLRVPVNSHGELKFDSRGKLSSHKVEPADPRQMRAMTDHLSKLVANGQIYFAKPGEKIDTDMLRAQGKPWYVEQDAQGNKHLKRAWIS